MENGIYLDMVLKYDNFELELCSNGEVQVKCEIGVLTAGETVHELITMWEHFVDLPEPLTPILKFKDPETNEIFRFPCPMDATLLAKVKKWYNGGNQSPTLVFQSDKVKLEPDTV